jgi:hypothetical protein
MFSSSDGARPLVVSTECFDLWGEDDIKSQIAANFDSLANDVRADDSHVGVDDGIRLQNAQHLVVFAFDRALKLLQSNRHRVEHVAQLDRRADVTSDRRFVDNEAVRIVICLFPPPQTNIVNKCFLDTNARAK